jgi:hypothetical protein
VRRNSADDLIVRYHDTDVVRVSSTLVYLDTGGWFTKSTKDRINQAANQYDLGFNVHQKARQWFVVTKRGDTFQFKANAISFLKP